MKKCIIVFVCIFLCHISFSATQENPKFVSLFSQIKRQKLSNDKSNVISLGLLTEEEIEDFYLYLVIKISKEELTFSEIPSNLFPEFINYCFRSIKYGKTPFKRYHSTIQKTTKFEKDDGLVEYEDDRGNIYTYAVAYSSKDKEIQFYSNRELASPNNGTSVKTSWGELIPTQQAHMNQIYYNQKHIPLENWVKTNISLGELIMPNNCYFRDNNIFLTYSKVHGKIDEIIYTPPRYIVIAGQLAEVNSGIHPQVSSHWIGSMSKINKNTMIMDKSVTFEGIGKSVLLSSDEHLFVYDGDNKYLSSIDSPIYILDYDLNIINMICPSEGDYYSDILETKDFFIFCGHSVKSGYVGYDNPLIVVIDKSTHKEIARKVYTEKDIRFKYLYLLSENEILVNTENAYERSLQSWQRENRNKDYRVLILSELIPEKYQSDNIKRLNRLSKIAIVQKHPSIDICVYKSSENGLYGLTRKSNISHFLTEPIFDTCDIKPHCIFASKNGQKALFNFFGIEFVRFGKYANIIDHEDYFEVHDKHGKVGVLSRNGSCIIPPKYEAVRHLCNIDNSEMLFQVVDEKKSGLINSNGRIIAPLIFQDFHLIPNTNLIVTYDDTGYQGLIDVAGVTIAEPSFKNFSEHIHDVNGRLVPTKDFFVVLDKDNKTGIVDITGKFIIQPQEFQSISVFPKSNFIMTKSNEGCNMYSNSGNLLASGYSSITEIEHGEYFMVSDAHGSFGLISRDGTEIIPPIYDKLDFFKNAPILAVEGSSYLAMTSTGLTFKHMNENPILAVKGTKCGVIRLNGEVLAPVKFKYVPDASYVILYNNKGKYAIMCTDDLQDNKLVKKGFVQTESLLTDHTFVVLIKK